MERIEKSSSENEPAGAIPDKMHVVPIARSASNREQGQNPRFSLTASGVL
jgi:hypothetical protein